MIDAILEHHFPPCECELRNRRWNPNTGQCETCRRRFAPRDAPGASRDASVASRAPAPPASHLCGSQGVDAEGHCVRCGLVPDDGSECPPGFLEPALGASPPYELTHEPITHDPVGGIGQDCEPRAAHSAKKSIVDGNIRIPPTPPLWRVGVTATVGGQPRRFNLDIAAEHLGEAINNVEVVLDRFGADLDTLREWTLRTEYERDGKRCEIDARIMHVSRSKP